MSFKEFLDTYPSVGAFLFFCIIFCICGSLSRFCERQTEELKEMKNEDKNNSPMANRKDG